jgi:hypothetical protein
MFFPRPIQWYHSRADLIWPDFTFNAIALPESYNSSNYRTYSTYLRTVFIGIVKNEMSTKLKSLHYYCNAVFLTASQCCGSGSESGSTGFTRFWASRIRIH